MRLQKLQSQSSEANSDAPVTIVDSMPVLHNVGPQVLWTTSAMAHPHHADIRNTSV